MVCERCGQPHPRCKGHNNRGEPCGRHAMKGGTVCWKHGGAAKQVRAANQRHLAEAEVVRFLSQQKIEPVGDPLRRLSEVLAEADAFYRFVSAKLGEIDVDNWESTSDQGIQQVSAYVALMERAMERVQKFLTEMVRLGIEDRLAKVDEAVAAKVIAALDAAMAEAGIEAKQAQALRQATGRHLRSAA